MKLPNSITKIPIRLNTAHKPSEGMSLIEVAVSIFLIFVLFLTYVAALNTVALVKKNNLADLAYHVANKQMESLRQIPFNSLSNTTNAPISDSMLSKIPSGAGSYTISDYSSMTGVKEIVITINWNDGTAKSVVVRSLAGLGGINP
jgi:hypothetical protein